MIPFYRFYPDRLKANLDAYIRDYTVYYPCKVNSEGEVIDIVYAAGACFETDSVDMIARLVEKGIPAGRILYNYLVRTDENIADVVAFGVRDFAVDDATDVGRIVAVCPDARFLIRVSISALTPDIITDPTQDKWGADFDGVTRIADAVGAVGCDIIGYSFYYPKEFSTVERISSAIETLLDRYGNDVVIDVGGGISTDDAGRIADTFRGRCGGFIIEPGRHLVGDTFDCVCGIVDVKSRNGRRYVFLNVGIYSGFIDAVLKKHDFEIVLDGASNGECETVVVCGCTSDISDTFGVYSLPRDLLVSGATAIIKNCGAYCLEMHTRFAGNRFEKKFISANLPGGNSDD